MEEDQLEQLKNMFGFNDKPEDKSEKTTFEILQEALKKIQDINKKKD